MRTEKFISRSGLPDCGQAGRSQSTIGYYAMAAYFCLSAIYLLCRVPTSDFLLSSNDQGYQMALGAAVAAGRLPGVDFVTQYGPFVAFSSYVGLALTGNVTGEMLVCALGYATAITIVVSIVWRETGWVASSAAFAAMLLMFPRYYKWYYCLFPIVGLAVAQRYWDEARARTNQLVTIFGWGLVTGTGVLFRFDLGFAGAVIGAVAIVTADLAVRRADTVRIVFTHVALFLFAAAILPVLYLAFIGALRDVAQIGIFLHSIYSGTADTVDYYSIRPFRIDRVNPTAQMLGLAALQAIMPAAYAIGAFISVKNLMGDPEKLSARDYTLFCAAVTGLGILPQAFHRADIQHLLQVMAPFFIVLALLGHRVVFNRHRHNRMELVAAAFVSGLALAAMVMVLPAAALDLGPVDRNPVRTWRMLARLPGSLRSNPVADMAFAIRHLTPPGSSVFLVMTPTDMPLLFFANRHQPGLIPTYEAGMFSGRFWLERNRAILRRTPPDFLVVPTVTTQSEVPAPFLPDLVRSWLRCYDVVLYANERYRLLAPWSAVQTGQTTSLPARLSMAPAASMALGTSAGALEFADLFHAAVIHEILVTQPDWISAASQ
jgi:hypothetical protein